MQRNASKALVGESGSVLVADDRPVAWLVVDGGTAEGSDGSKRVLDAKGDHMAWVLHHLHILGLCNTDVKAHAVTSLCQQLNRAQARWVIDW